MDLRVPSSFGIVKAGKPHSDLLTLRSTPFLFLRVELGIVFHGKAKLLVQSSNSTGFVIHVPKVPSINCLNFFSSL